MGQRVADTGEERATEVVLTHFRDGPGSRFRKYTVEHDAAYSGTYCRTSAESVLASVPLKRQKHSKEQATLRQLKYHFASGTAYKDALFQTWTRILLLKQ